MKCPKCNYENTDAEALYCGLCYEMLKRAPVAPPAAVPEEIIKEEPEKEGAPLLQIAILAGLLSGAAVYFYGNAVSDQGKATAALETVRLGEKIAATEKLLANYNKGRDELIGEITAGKIDPEGFGPEGRYTKKLFKLEEDYVHGIYILRLSCQRYTDEGNNAACLKWSEDYAAKETSTMEDFNKKYQQLVPKAGN